MKTDYKINYNKNNDQNNNTKIINEDGIHIATIHGEFNIDIVAEFFIKTPIIKKDIGQTA